MNRTDGRLISRLICLFSSPPSTPSCFGVGVCLLFLFLAFDFLPVFTPFVFCSGLASDGVGRLGGSPVVSVQNGRASERVVFVISRSPALGKEA
jgi:hypothetical protein